MPLCLLILQAFPKKKMFSMITTVYLSKSRHLILIQCSIIHVLILKLAFDKESSYYGRIGCLLIVTVATKAKSCKAAGTSLIPGASSVLSCIFTLPSIL